MKIFFLFLLFIITLNFVKAQNIELSGNGIVIASDGTNIPNTLDGTDYGGLVAGSFVTNTFSITNIEINSPPVQIRSITSSSIDFSIVKNIPSLKPGDTGIFDIIFQPSSAGVKNAVITIIVKKRNVTKEFSFHITGFSIGNIMISQYYEKDSNDKIEIKNLTNNVIPNGNYFLAIYNKSTDTSGWPDNSFSLSGFTSGEVKLIGSNDLFKGDEIIIISTSNKKDCFEDRVDIIGDQNSSWGDRRSFTKGGCASETSHLDFDINDWIEVGIEKVNTSDVRQNIALGTYNVGPVSWNGSTWSNNALPDLSTIAIIDGNYDADLGNIEACDLEINSTLDLDGETTNSVVVYRDLHINGTFIIGNQESLVMYDDNAEITGEIIKKESSTYRNNAYDFTYWSSPIVNGDIETVLNGVTSSRIFYFDQSQTSESDPNHPDFWNTWMNASGTMIQGKGYAAEGLTGITGVHHITFSGKPNNGIIGASVFEWNDDDMDNDFNLIGNPYPSAVDIELFFDANLQMIDPTAYLWTHNTPISNGDSGDFAFDDYATYNYTGGTSTGGGQIPNKNIGSGQGFFVRAINSGNVVFNNSMRLEDANDQFFKMEKSKILIEKEEEKDRVWLNLTTGQGGFNQLLIGFIENASNGDDKGYDALKFDGGNPISFYSTMENKKYTIQGIGSYSTEQTIDLGFDTEVAPRTFSISIDRTEGKLKNSEIYLIDNILNITHDLKRSDYKFKVDKVGENLNRFSLHFAMNSVLLVDDFKLINDFKVSNSENEIHIVSDLPVKSIKVFDILGRMLIKDNPDKTSFYLKRENNKSAKIYIIVATLENGHIISKKTILY